MSQHRNTLLCILMLRHASVWRYWIMRRQKQTRVGVQPALGTGRAALASHGSKCVVPLCNTVVTETNQLFSSKFRNKCHDFTCILGVRNRKAYNNIFNIMYCMSYKVHDCRLYTNNTSTDTISLKNVPSLRNTLHYYSATNSQNVWRNISPGSLQYRLALDQCSETFFSPAAHPNLSKTHDGTPQNFASWKGGTKLYMAINMYLHINSCPIRM
jgi:hypothetical protein